MKHDVTPPTANGETWPAVDEAYEWAKLSYQWIIQRLDSVDASIQALQTFAATLTLAAFVVAGAALDDVDFESIWLILALVLFVAIILIGSLGRAWGSIRVVSPRDLYNEWLHYNSWEFKKNILYFAGDHFLKNRTLVNAKGWVANGITLLLALEVGALVVWIAKQM